MSYREAKMKRKKPFEKYDTLINELVKAHNTICLTYKLQQELNVPDDITNKLAFVLKTIKATLQDLEKLKNTEKFLWEDFLSQFSIV